MEQFGETARDIAVKWGHGSIVALLDKAAAVEKAAAGRDGAAEEEMAEKTMAVSIDMITEVLVAKRLEGAALS